MVKKLSLLLFTAIVVTLVSFMFLHNRDSVTVTYAPGKTISGQIALILIYAFTIGVLVSSIVAFFLGTKLRLRNRKLVRQVKLTQDHMKKIEDARGQLALGDFASAQDLLSKIIQKDPDNISARIELAETFQRNGDLQGALQILNQARIEQKKNVELLLLASDINGRLGNHTAEFDNAALILQIKPRSKYALERVVASSAQLGRFDEAVSYQSELARTLSGEEYTAAQLRLAELELRRAVRDGQSDTKTLRSGLETVLRNHRDYPPALTMLAEVELAEGNTDAAVKFWKKAFALTRSAAPLESIAVAMLERDRPAQAVGAVRAAIDAVRDRPSAELVPARLFLIQLLMHLEMLDDAESEFRALPAGSGEIPSVAGAHAVLHAQLLRRKGNSDEAFSALTEQAAASIAPYSARLLAGGTPQVSRTALQGERTDWNQRLEVVLTKPTRYNLSVTPSVGA